MRLLKLVSLTGLPTSEPRCVARLRASDRRRFQETVVDKFSISPEMAELLVPDALFSAKFETDSHIPGVSPRLNATN